MNTIAGQICRSLTASSSINLAGTVFSCSSSSCHPILTLLEDEACSSRRRVDLRALHALSLTSGAVSDPFAGSRLLDTLLRHGGAVDSAYIGAVFDSLPTPDEYTWNALIAAHARHRSPRATSLRLYFRMRAVHRPSPYTFSLLAKACAADNSGPAVAEGRMVHAQAAKCGAESLPVVRNSLMAMYCALGFLSEARQLFDEIPSKTISCDPVPWNTLISSYGKEGEVHRARDLFDRMPHRNLVSWSAMIDGYIRCNEHSQALTLFIEMERNTDLCPDVVIIVSALKACAHLGELGHGRRLHLLARRHHPVSQHTPRLAAALADMYSKCGCVDSALEIFNAASSRDVVLWNVMISGLALHGRGKAALELFRRMKLAGEPPNGSTFIAVLRACCHAGLVKEGREVFAAMAEHGVEKSREHYGCFADLLARAGLLLEAEEVVRLMPMEAEAAQWGAVMAACRTHGDATVGLRVGPQLISMEPKDGGRYVLMANTFVATERWEEAGKARAAMEASGAKKEVGKSSVELAGAAAPPLPIA